MRSGRKALPVKERFWRQVSCGAPDECWLWTGCLTQNGKGYGAISVSGRQVATHRVAWTLEYGPIPPGKHVCHHCDVPRCCNPAHLFLGTHAENIRDMMHKRWASVSHSPRLSR